MKAIITKQVENARNMAGEKETISKYIVLAKIKGQTREIVDARVYMGRSRNSSTVYASIWVHGADSAGREIYTTGRGAASGYGYHKESAAIASAISSAGIELYGSPYSDENGYFWDEKPNPNWRPFDERTKEEQEDRNYGWHTPRNIREKRKESARDYKNRVYFGGCGDSAIKTALMAIAKAAGGSGKLIIVSM